MFGFVVRASRKSFCVSLVPPNTSRFFSGKRFPLATPANMDVHRLVLGATWPFVAVEAFVYEERRFMVAVTKWWAC